MLTLPVHRQLIHLMNCKVASDYVGLWNRREFVGTRGLYIRTDSGVRISLLEQEHARNNWHGVYKFCTHVLHISTGQCAD